MGSMKQKRRKKAKKEWEQLQSQHELSVSDIKQARQTGYPLKRFQTLLVVESSENGTSKSQRIHEIYREWQETIVARQAAIQAGLVEPKKKMPAKKPKHDSQLAKAKAVCGLNMNDIRKAKELGLSPQALFKNTPSPNQQWKAPVKVWIQELYEKRIASRSTPSNGLGSDVNDNEPVNVAEM